MTALNLSIDELFEGNATLLKEKKFYSAKHYAEPFIDRISKVTDNITIQAMSAPQTSLDENGEVNDEHKVFNRVWIQGILPDEYAYENHQQSINMLYALDTRKPVVKFFKNTVNMACLNMCVFNPEMMEIQELVPEESINYKGIDRIMQVTDESKVMLDKLKNTIFDRTELIDNLGLWVDDCITNKFDAGFGTVKLTETTPIAAYKEVVYNEKSPYYIKEGPIDGFTMYNAFTDIITHDKRDIVNKFEKIYLVSKLMRLV